MRLGDVWATDRTSGTSTPWPSRGRCNHSFPSRRVGPALARLATLPYDLSHPGMGGPAVLDQETPVGTMPPGKPGNRFSYTAAWWALSSAGSSLMPGPMVVLTVTPFR